ncbi:MAG: hypothetical protein JNL92_14790 [Opitutaceae bacterium]|nr:hypothetical protein [Opitutaceae bacterium]
MKTTARFTRGLRIAALVLFVAGIGLWAAAGAHVGWTQTSTVTLQRDEITGIDFPVRRAALVPGVEFPLAATLAAAALAGLSLLPRPNRAAALP